MQLAIGLALVGLAGAPSAAADAPGSAGAGGATTVTATPRHRFDQSAIARWQHADGSWSETPASDLNDGPNQNFCTGLAVLGFLGAGYDHLTPNVHRQTVLNGLTWICSHQRADGSFPGSLIDNAVQSMALSEAFAMTNDPNIRTAARRGIQALLARRVMIASPLKAQAWPDIDGRISTRTNTFCILAVKSAMAAQLLPDGTVLNECAAWLLATWQAATPHGAGTGPCPTAFPAYMDFAHVPAIATGSDLHAGLTAAVFLSKNPLIQPVVASLVPQLLSESIAAPAPLDGVDQWFRTLDTFQFGNTEQFMAWSTGCKSRLAATEVHGGPLDGGWDAQVSAVAPVSGPVSQSLLNVMALEVTYRWECLRIAK